MAKVGFWLKGARGKLAGSVLANSPTGTIIRENKVGANPKTMSQAIQRACFATASKTSVALKAIVESSFDGAKNGEDSRRAFVALATQMLKAQYLNGTRTLHLVGKKSNLEVPNILQVSKGDLGKIELKDGYTLEGKDYLTILGGTTTDGGLTFGQFRAKYPAAKPGSQLTFVWGEISDDENATFRWKYARIVLNPNIKDSDLIINQEDVCIPATAIVSAKTEGFKANEDTGEIGLDDLSFMALTGNKTEMKWSFYNDKLMSGQALIISNYENGEWLHTSSFTQCMLTNDNTPAIESYMNIAKAAEATSDYYTEQAEPVDEGNVSYDSLNQALQGIIRSQGYQPKTLNLESSNTYGPIPEGNIVEITLNENVGVSALANTIKVLNGETAVPNVWVRRINSSMVAVSFPIAFGSEQSANINITFDVAFQYQSAWENMGFRTTIQKVQG